MKPNWITHIQLINENFESEPFPVSCVQPGLDMSVRRILELYGAGCPPAVSHDGIYDDIRDNDSDFDFYQPEDVFEVEDYLKENSPDLVRERQKAAKKAKEVVTKEEPPKEEKTPQEGEKGA